ncbi:hypothetical protein BDQ17DRAFT_1338106 [Cyathus striatus]|nr:hypothetical protein BDQ17DRAFT_1338106 [Cyathus striatus]
MALSPTKDLVIKPSSSPHVDNAISHSIRVLKIAEGVSELVGFPPVKVVATALIQVLELVADEISYFPKDFMESDNNFTKLLGDYERDLLEMLHEAEKLMRRHCLKQLFSSTSTKDKLKKYQGQLDRKTWNFTLLTDFTSNVQKNFENDHMISIDSGVVAKYYY